MKACYHRYYTQWYYAILDYNLHLDRSFTVTEFEIPNPCIVETDKHEQIVWPLGLGLYSNLEEYRSYHPEYFL